MDEPASGGGGGPAPFLLKTYDMIDDSSTDRIVSWSSNNNSFVVWNPPEFARLLLPTYFKHNNFSSFIRQLNTYGFRKIDPERWEFLNEDFIKDKKHLLKNIHRRKPIHSHSHPQGSSVDPERAAFEEEFERLSREKAVLEAKLLGIKQQQSTAKPQLEDLKQRVENMELRQENLLTSLQKAVKNPAFVEHLARKIESMDISAYNKKRRKPQLDQSKPITESMLLDDNSCSISRPESGNVFLPDISNKLRLELSPAVSDINLVSHSTQSSTEDGGSPQKKNSEVERMDLHPRPEGNLYGPETFELSDTGASFTFKMDSFFSRKVPENDCPGVVHSLQQRLTSSEEADSLVSCHLNLTLASSPLQVHKGLYSSRMLQRSDNVAKTTELRYDSNVKDSEIRLFPNNRNLGLGDTSQSSQQEGQNNNPGPAAAPARVNDVFWEQFLTERPGSSDNEEASSSYRGNPFEEQEEKSSGLGISKNAKSMEQLTL